MARALPHSPVHEFGAMTQPGEWQALRGDLVALLDQVESQYVAGASPEPEFDRLARRVRDLRQKVAEPEGGHRHEAALRSVQKAVDRFSERDEVEVQGREAQMMQRNPRDMLQSAIEEIRSGPSRRPLTAERRHESPQTVRDSGMDRDEAEARQQMAAQRRTEAERFERLAGAVGGLGTRLEQLEGELKSQGARRGDVREIGEQVSQLAGVVEMLAGAVGETGQVKRLEAQIQALSRTMDQGPKVDLSTLTKRIGDLSGTVERLADMQAQQLARDAATAPQTGALQEGMRSVESSVRSVYDRIDAMERSYAISSGDFERLTEDMAAFMRAMRENQSEPATLVARVDALHARIDELDDRHGVLNDLRDDVALLRGAVVSTFEPRFSALEEQIDSLSDKLSARRQSDPGIAKVQDQIQKLFARVDDTAEQLAALARHYSESEPREPAPDFQALATMVARETSEAMARTAQREPALDLDALATLVARRTSDAVAQQTGRQAPPNVEQLASLVASKTSEAVVRSTPQRGPEFSEAGLDALEERMSRLFATASKDAGAEEFSGVQDGIRRVDERLERLEAALERSHKSQLPLSTALELLPAEEPPAPPARPRMRDSMPASPAQEAPLTDTGFAAMGSVRDALAGRAAEAPREPAPPAPAQRRADAAASRPDLGHIERPPRPESSLAGPSPLMQPVPAETQGRAEPRDGAPASSRNTFIEAARRAAQKPAAAQPDAGSNSLIGRALARFQPGAAEAPAKPAAAAQSMPPLPREPEPAKPKGKRAGRGKAARTPVAPTPAAFEHDAIRIEPGERQEGPKESFLMRHRQPILLAAAMIAVSLMTLNLIGQRMSPELAPQTAAQSELGELSDPAPGTEPVETFDDSSAAAEGLETDASSLEEPRAVSSLASGPRMIAATGPAGIDPVSVGSIGPSAALGPQGPTSGPLLDAVPGEVASLPTDIAIEPAGPVAVELPPESLGPEQLRQAAANGDARAQFEVAAIYTEGHAVTQDFAAAATWYERSAAQGFAPAQYRLGSLYESGKGVEKDLDQARLWYTRAAEAGNRMSMHNLAALYAGGELGTQDFASAAKWFEEAARRGMTDSQFNLGMLYARGLGVTQDMEASYKWFSLAAGRGDADAVKARDDVAKSLDADAMGRVSAQIASWMPGGIDLAANFAPIGTWSAQFDPGAAITDKEIVLKVQAALSRLGYDVGTPDGVMGPKTGEAIKAFERATGMSEIGAINPRLLAVLGSQPV